MNVLSVCDDQFLPFTTKDWSLVEIVSTTGRAPANLPSGNSTWCVTSLSRNRAISLALSHLTEERPVAVTLVFTDGTVRSFDSRQHRLSQAVVDAGGMDVFVTEELRDVADADIPLTVSEVCVTGVAAPTHFHSVVC